METERLTIVIDTWNESRIMGIIGEYIFWFKEAKKALIHNKYKRKEALDLTRFMLSLLKDY